MSTGENQERLWQISRQFIKSEEIGVSLDWIKKLMGTYTSTWVMKKAERLLTEAGHNSSLGETSPSEIQTIGEQKGSARNYANSLRETEMSGTCSPRTPDWEVLMRESAITKRRRFL